MERKFTFKKPSKSSLQNSASSSIASVSVITINNNVKNNFICKDNSENILKPASSVSSLLNSYSSGNVNLSNQIGKKSESALILNLENEDLNTFKKKTEQKNDKSKSVHPFFDQKNKITLSTIESNCLNFEDDDENDFKKPKKNDINIEMDLKFEKNVVSPKVTFTTNKQNEKTPESMIKKQTIEEPLINHKEFCPSCKCKYTPNGAKRRLIDACDHGACFSCVMKQIKCVVCEKLEQIENNFDDKLITEAGINKENLENISISPEKNDSKQKMPDSPIISLSKNKLVIPDSEDELEDFKPLKVTTSIKEFENTEKKGTKDNEEIYEIEEDFKSLTNTSTQKAIIQKELNNNTIEDEEDDDLCVIEDFDFDMFDSKNGSGQMLNNKQTKGVYIPEIEKYEKINWLFNDIKDCSYQFRSVEYEHTEEMLSKFRNSFGLKHFRPQQFEAVNAALLGMNVFILMPTGGGKSLCYQLPAVISKGVTFVVSPLKSLIIDQVQKLNALGLSACHMLSDVDSSECDNVYKELVKQEPRYKLVYITPEKLNNSSKLRNVVTNLYNRGMIARLVIDEAHCVSQWGHDFRTDYKKIGELRFTLMPNVACMLLTATATPRVRNDILMQMKLTVSETASLNNSSFKSAFVTSVQSNQLSKLETKLNSRQYMSAGMQNMPVNNQKCVFFMQSFNRENLQYQVEYKTSNGAALEKISELIKSKYANKSGIVYCISRNECEQVSEFLRKHQIKALPYHAGMDDKKRQQIQHKWTNNIDCKVVCATIAFGMGIDKPDVRFVFHLSLPKSLEGYYQESGRAGRDGSKALCLLFFNNEDRKRLFRIISLEFECKNSLVFETHLENISRVAQYCDNRADCRRAQIMEYFGEAFDRKKCIDSKMNTVCDNCQLLRTKNSESIDLTKTVKLICNSIKKICPTQDLTLNYLADVLKGSLRSKIIQNNHQSLDFHSKMNNFSKYDIERFLRKLVFSRYLKEELKVVKNSDIVACYLRPGPNISEVFKDENFKFQFELIKDKIIYKKTDKLNSDNKDSDENESKIDAKNNKELNLILNRCKCELNRLIKSLGIEHKLDNINLIFTKKMIQEMLTFLPTDKESLFSITGYTEAIFNNYKGNEFLKLFQHYSNLKTSILAKDNDSSIEFSNNCKINNSSNNLLINEEKVKHKINSNINQEPVKKPKILFK